MEMTGEYVIVISFVACLCCVPITIEETMRPVTIAQVSAFGEVLATDWHGVWAAWVEAATGGRVNQAGNLSTCWEGDGAFTVRAKTVGVWCG